MSTLPRHLRPHPKTNEECIDVPGVVAPVKVEDPHVQEETRLLEHLEGGSEELGVVPVPWTGDSSYREAVPVGGEAPLPALPDPVSCVGTGSTATSGLLRLPVQEDVQQAQETQTFARFDRLLEEEIDRPVFIHSSLRLRMVVAEQPSVAASS